MDFDTASPVTELRPLPLTHSAAPAILVPSVLRVENRAERAESIGADRVTFPARRHALWELARRAGVPIELFRMWNIRSEAGGILLELFPGTGKQVFFPRAGAKLLKQLAEGHISVSRRTWMHEPHPAVKHLVPAFIVPFSSPEESPHEPLFFACSSDRVESTVDLPLSILLSLSRWEESVVKDRDSHGRFIATQSVAFREGFLNRPVVDEYGLAFEQVLIFLIHSWRPPQRTLRAKLSHDADHVGIPFRWKNALRHTVRYRAPLNTWHELWGNMPGCEPVDLKAIREITRLSVQRKLDSAVYWMASRPGPCDSGYDPRHQKVRQVIDWLRERNIESGVQPGYQTFRSPERLRREIAVLREVLGDEPLGGRQHYLRWCPDTWIHWETCGLAYDSTLCYAEHIGFRAGTCIPYKPWLFSINREADLLEIPLLVMDRTLVVYMGLTEEKALEAVRDCVARCRAVGGVFTMVWHNNTLPDPKYRSIYHKLLNMLDGAARLDWWNEFRRFSS